MKTINSDSISLTEVWKWKEKVYNKYLNKNEEEKFETIKSNSEVVIKKLGLKKFSSSLIKTNSVL